jgi:hypothetical protein
MDTAYMRIFSLYRDSGLIPEKIAVKHRDEAIAKFGGNRCSPEAIEFLEKKSGRYIKQYGKCPKCGERGFSETILGYICKHCNIICGYIQKQL